MSLRELVDPDCGGANPLMRLGNQIVNDVAHKDDGISGRRHDFAGPSTSRSGFNDFNETQLVNEFLGQMRAPPPQTFRMDALLQEMREIDAQRHPVQAPTISAEVNKSLNWANEFNATKKLQSQTDKLNEIMWQESAKHQQFQSHGHLRSIQHIPQTSSLTTAEFFDRNIEQNHMPKLHVARPHQTEQFRVSEFMNFMNKVDDANVNKIGEKSWTEEFEQSQSSTTKTGPTNLESDWVQDFADQKAKQEQDNAEFNNRFWDRLQDEWKKMSDRMDEQSPWLSEFSEYYDPYREYTFDEENPMLNTDNAFEKGKAFLAQGDIPSAVLCFEAAVRQDGNNAEIWELLGTSQAENEKDPNAIAALKKSLELNPNNRKALMALAISYTNESLQNQALRCLIDWLRASDRYRHLVTKQYDVEPGAPMASSLINGPDLTDVQNLFIRAVQQSTDHIDPEIQEALGVLFNLSSDYDKAADCFRAALQIKPDNAKLWNRLGASLANGNLSIEAVDAYQHALAIEPGYIRARYNVGIICINLKAYKEAIEHFLMALNHQATSMERSGLDSVRNSNNQMSDTIWSTLRMAVSLMGKPELQTAIDNRDLNVLNKAFAEMEGNATK